MLTLFAIPKAFAGHTRIIQRNAIRSWTLLRPTPQIILIGDDPGVAEAAAEFGVEHVPRSVRNEHGTPLLCDMFAQAQRMATHDLLCHVNADIILTSSLFSAIERLQQQCVRFSMFCTPWNLRIEEELDFGSEWEARLRHAAHTLGRPPKPVGVDTFLFPRGFYDGLPPLAVGRTAQDNWLLYRACRGRIPAVDATPSVLSIHQAHAGTTHSGSSGMNEQYRRNQQIAGWWARSFVAADLPYELPENGHLRKKGIRERLRPRVRAVLSTNAVIRVLDHTYKLRRKVGLYRARRPQPE